jgi:tripartite-type tricarboxylate transporter receptor subunit TctC
MIALIYLMMKSTLLHSLSCLLITLCAIATTQAQTYPTRTVRIIVPASPGGGSDMQARLLGKRFTDSMGHPFVVDNRVGASGVIGAELVARAPADGYTLLVATAQIPINLLLLKKAPIDMVRDLAPVTQFSFAPQFFMVHPSVPARSVPELVALAKKQPGKLNAGSSGNGSANHMAIEMLKLAASISVTHVPYRSGGPSIAALIGGETDFSFSGAVTALPHVRSGKVRALAVTSSKRTAVAPNLPTMDTFFPATIRPTGTRCSRPPAHRLPSSTNCTQRRRPH